MTIVYDLLGVQSKEHGERGIARYVLNLALALEETDPDLIDVFLVRDYLPKPGVLEPLVRSGKVKSIGELAANPPDSGVYFVASPYELGEGLDSILPVWARGPGWQRCGVLYDLIPMIFPDIYLSDLWAKRYRARTTTVSQLDHLFAISEASKQDAVRLLGCDPSAITMIAAGADERFAPPSVPLEDIVAELRKGLPTLRDNYVLFPSGIEWRKNLNRMLDAYARLSPETRHDHQLVMVCRTNEGEQQMLEFETDARGIRKDFLATGFVEDADLVRLYQAASLVVFPSLYEGFGLPVLEARQCGAPAICSDSSSLKEVQPDRSARFDPYDVDEMAAVLGRTLGQPSELSRLRDAEIPPFTWQWGAERVGPVLRDLEDRTFASPKPRLAVVSPLPPQRSGIATYAHRLLSPITDLVDLTVLVDVEPDTVIGPPGATVRHIREWQTLERIDGAFDQVLYFMGNSQFHVEALEMLRHRPGPVLMHDARMTGLYEMQFELAAHRLPLGTVGGFLRHWYPTTYRESLYHNQIILAPEADRFGILLTREITEYATDVWTHSNFAASLIELDSGVATRAAFPIPVATLKAETGRTPNGGSVITTFGHVDGVKRPEVLIEALRLVRANHRDAILRFVGQADKYQTAKLEKLIEAAGLVGAVEITGHVSDEEYAEALVQTTIALQLRAFTNGESSAAVADLLGSGVPVVVSDIGAMSELPIGVVEFVGSHATAPDIASTISQLLDDPSRRAEMIRSGLEYASENSYETASHRMLELLFPSRFPC